MGELYRKTVRPHILLKKTFLKAKNLLHKTLHNLKSILFRAHHRLPKICYFNPFFSGSNKFPNCIIQELDDFYRDFSQQLDYSDHNEVLERKSICEEPVKDQGMGKRAIFHEEKVGESFLESAGKGQSLAQKMEELEMMDEEDLDQMLDIEEVLHYYSRLTCPVYLDIVDRFFVNMYNEFSLPLRSINFNSSMRTLGPIKL